MSDRFQDQVLAFAAIYQAAEQVQKVARHGSYDEQSFTPCIQSLLVTDPKNTLEVFSGEIAHLRAGLKMLVDHMGNNPQKDPEITRYVVSLLALERKMTKRRDLMSLMGTRIEQVKRQCNHFELTDDTILGNLADIYSEFVSPLGPRIQVSGAPLHLQQPANQHRVRSLLLAGIRAAVLWRQVGGKRRMLLLHRMKLVKAAEELLKQAY